jgi:MYXO-CTERM domain-containing protein
MNTAPEAVKVLGVRMDFYGDDPVTISSVSVPRDRIFKEVFYIPALLLLGLVVLLQLRRRRAA